MAEILTIASNATNAKLHTENRAAKLAASAILSYAVAGAETQTAFKQGHWDGRSSLFDFASGMFPAGFVLYLAAGLKKKGYEIRFVKRPLPAPLGPEHPVVDSFPEDPRYDYQRQIPDLLLRHGQIIAQVATGGGKSRIARLCYARINRPTLFLTTRGILMYQMHDAFEKDMGVPVSVLGDGQFGFVGADGRSFIKKMSVGMVQTLVSRLEEKTFKGELIALMQSLRLREEKALEAFVQSRQNEAARKKSTLTFEEIEREAKVFAARQAKERPTKEQLELTAKKRVEEQARIRARTIELLKVFEFVILEEAHEVSGNGYFDILKHCTNANYRLSLTATPFMKNDEEANMRLMACSGPIAIKITEKMLIDRGILAKPYFKIVPLRNAPPGLRKRTSWQAAYRLGIVKNDERNAIIVAEAARAARYGLSVMTLVQQKAHGDILKKLMTDAGLKVAFIQGEDKQAERKAALRSLAVGEYDVLIGTTILDVGVDVPAVGMVILAGGGKAEVALRQRIGRGLRAKKTMSNVAFVVDFDDPHNTYLKDHALQRRSIIEGTPGFAENILPAGADFDFEGLGFTALGRAA